MSVAGGQKNGYHRLACLFFCSPSFFFIHHSDLATVSLTLPDSLHIFLHLSHSPSPFRAGVAIPSVALGMYLTLVGLQADGCESVSREEEEEVVVRNGRACQAVNRRRDAGRSFVAMGCYDTEEQFELPVPPVTSDKSWTPAPSRRNSPGFADLQRWLKRLRKRSVRSPVRWK